MPVSWSVQLWGPGTDQVLLSSPDPAPTLIQRPETMHRWWPATGATWSPRAEKAVSGQKGSIRRNIRFVNPCQCDNPTCTSFDLHCKKITAWRPLFIDVCCVWCLWCSGLSWSYRLQFLTGLQVTCSMVPLSLPSVGLCWRDSSRLPSAEPEPGRVHPNQAGN